MKVRARDDSGAGARVPVGARPAGLISTREAAAALGVSERTVRRAILGGELEATKDGSAYAIDAASLARFAAGADTMPGPRPLARVIAFPGVQDAAPLPEPLSTFIGRGADVAAVVALLNDPAARLITLTGPGGIGKTRLAIAAAGAVAADAFADGAVFVALADVPSPELALPAIAQALGVRERPGQDLLAHLAATLRRKHALLVLDNFEQILAAGPDVATLLTAAPDVKALVTSRAPLRVAGEREHRLAPMTVAGPGASPTELLASDAGRLFAERARGHDAAFAVDEETAPLLADICARLDGLPLAIELAAARVTVLPPRQLQVRLQRRLPLLTRGAHDAPARHATMRNAIAWSYDLLSLPEQRLFRCLAVFEGGFTLDAVAWIAHAGVSAPSSDELDMVADLVEHNLVAADVGPGGASRFRLLEIIREFGLEQVVAAGEENEARVRHAAYFQHLARRLRPWVSMHARQAPLQQLAAEQANLTQALQWLDDHGPAADLTELVAALCEYWATLGLFRDAARWLERALGQQEEATASDRARLLVGHAATLTVQGRFAEAEAVLAEALALGETACDPLDRARALFFRAGGLFVAGAYAAAEELLHEAHGLAERLDDPVLCAAVAGRALANLSLCARVQADFARAMAFSEESLRLYEGKQLDLAESIALLDLGAAAFGAGDYRLAVERWREGVTAAGEHGDLRQVADALSGIANVAVAWGQSRAALLLFGAAEALRERMGFTMLWRIDIAAAEGSLTSLRQSLGEEAVAVGLREGRALSLPEAIAIAAAVTTPAGGAQAEPASSDALTRREREILALLAEQRTDREVAEALYLSPRTVNWHVASILAKLGCATRREAVAKARAVGLV